MKKGLKQRQKIREIKEKDNIFKELLLSKHHKPNHLMH
jgi:hypothetical protein